MRVQYNLLDHNLYSSKHKHFWKVLLPSAHTYYTKQTPIKERAYLKVTGVSNKNVVTLSCIRKGHEKKHSKMNGVVTHTTHAHTTHTHYTCRHQHAHIHTHHIHTHHTYYTHHTCAHTHHTCAHTPHAHTHHTCAHTPHAHTHAHTHNMHTHITHAHTHTTCTHAHTHHMHTHITHVHTHHMHTHITHAHTHNMHTHITHAHTHTTCTHTSHMRTHTKEGKRYIPNVSYLLFPPYKDVITHCRMERKTFEGENLRKLGGNYNFTIKTLREKPLLTWVWY